VTAPEDKPSIADLEQILEVEGEGSLEILPSGEVRRPEERPARLPLTFQQDLPSHY
jgi:hypothetical protein